MYRKLGAGVFSTMASALVLAFVCMAFGSSAQAQAGSSGSRSRVLITQKIDESRLVTLAGNTRPEVRTAEDHGRVDDGLALDHMLLQLRRSPEQETAAAKLIEDLHNPKSPNYHQWITANEFGERFGLADQDVRTITGWLESHGFGVDVVYPGTMVIDFSGTAGQVREAFRTEIHNITVNGEEHIANTTDPKIPAALGPAVVGIFSLHDFKPQAMHTMRPKTDFTFSLNGFEELAVAPADLATIYNLNPLFNEGITGEGQSIDVVEDTFVFKAADWTEFRSTFGLSGFTSGSFDQTTPEPPKGTKKNCMNPGANFADDEAILDAEWSSAAAPNAAIHLVACSDTVTTFGGLIAIQNVVNGSTPPDIMSMSYGVCEVFTGAAENAGFNTAFQQAVAEGISVFVSSGDDSAAGCDRGSLLAVNGINISGWASSPNDVAVGGTDFGDTFLGTNATYWSATNTPTFGSALSYVPEIPWNDTCASALISIAITGSPIAYGPLGTCNTPIGEEFLGTAGGSGGPSSCATGTPVPPSGVSDGTCAGYAKPSYQSGVVGIPSDGVRDIPDVSLFAANGVWGHFYVFCFTDPKFGATCPAGTPSEWSFAGGTSFSSPIVAGIQALVNQKVGGRQGNPNFVYYQLAATEYGTSGNPSCSSTLGNLISSSCIFNDVTLGDMDVPCTGIEDCFKAGGHVGILSTSDSSPLPAYGTTTGWDFATGIGTINATNLVNAWPTAGSGVTPKK
jgi:subtilase family serine protease